MANSILVVGLGPAGTSIANFLARLDYHVVAIDSAKQTCQLKIGESLPPDAKQLLQQLDVWPAFRGADHEKCYGNQSYWYSDKPTYHDFMQHPVGHGWHIDRLEFERMLLHKAEQLAVDMRWQTKIASLTKVSDGWRVLFDNDAKAQSFQFIVDASGRQSWLARKLGIDRLYEVEQLALVAFAKITGEFADSTSLVETVDNGWWYSAKIPNNRIATALIFNPAQQLHPIQANSHSWYSQLSQAQHTKARLMGCELLTKPKIVAADSSILQQTHGDAWLAIGDAAMSYDPLAAHGLMMAMVSARDAAAAIDSSFKGRTNALAMYSQRMAESFLHYCEVRRGLVS